MLINQALMHFRFELAFLYLLLVLVFVLNVLLLRFGSSQDE
jgi:hypothetical protein